MNIIVVSYIGSPWLKDCLESMREAKYPIYVAMNSKAFNNYESAGLILGMKLCDDFVLIQDSTIIKDVKLFELFDNHLGPISLGNDYLMYMGKYSWQSLVNQQGIPMVNNKMDAVKMEISWLKNYAQLNHIPSMFPDFTDRQVFEEKHGKKRMVIENQYLIKYKNCWDMHMVDGADKVQ